MDAISRVLETEMLDEDPTAHAKIAGVLIQQASLVMPGGDTRTGTRAHFPTRFSPGVARAAGCGTPTATNTLTS